MIINNILAQKHPGANAASEITLAKIFVHDSMQRVKNALDQLER